MTSINNFKKATPEQRRAWGRKGGLAAKGAPCRTIVLTDKAKVELDNEELRRWTRWLIERAESGGDADTKDEDEA